MCEQTAKQESLIRTHFGPGQAVTVLIVNHKHGQNVWVCENRKVADQELYDYVVDNWDDEEGPVPKDIQEAIDEYFDGQVSGEEWGDFIETTVIMEGGHE